MGWLSKFYWAFKRSWSELEKHAASALHIVLALGFCNLKMQEDHHFWGSSEHNVLRPRNWEWRQWSVERPREWEQWFFFFFFFLSGMNFGAEIRSPLCNSRNSNTGCTNLRKWLQKYTEYCCLLAHYIFTPLFPHSRQIIYTTAHMMVQAVI